MSLYNENTLESEQLTIVSDAEQILIGTNYFTTFDVVTTLTRTVNFPASVGDVDVAYTADLVPIQTDITNIQTSVVNIETDITNIQTDISNLDLQTIFDQSTSPHIVTSTAKPSLVLQSSGGVNIFNLNVEDRSFTIQASTVLYPPGITSVKALQVGGLGAIYMYHSCFLDGENRADKFNVRNLDQVNIFNVDTVNGKVYVRGYMSIKDPVSGYVFNMRPSSFSQDVTMYLPTNSSGNQIGAGSVLVLSNPSTGQTTFSYLSLNDLSNVALNTPVISQTLLYNGSNWVNGYQPIDMLQGVAINSPAIGEVLKFSGSYWTNGSLSLSFLTDIAFSTIATNDVLLYSAGKWRNTQLYLDTLSDLIISTPISTEVLMYNGSSWVNSLLKLSELDEVNITTPLTGHVLRYDGAVWSNSAISASALNDLSDVVITAPSQWQHLAYNSGTWENTSIGLVNGLTSTYIPYASGASSLSNSPLRYYASILSSTVPISTSDYFSVLGGSYYASIRAQSLPNSVNFYIPNHVSASTKSVLRLTDTSNGYTAWGELVMNDLTDVTITYPQSGQYLKYNGSKWFNTIFNSYLTEMADVTITSPSVTQVLTYSGSEWINSKLKLSDLNEVVITTPSTDQVLKYDGTDWINSDPTEDNIVKSTGIISGGILSGSGSQFNISAGSGVVVNNTILPYTSTNVSWSSLSNITDIYLASAPITFIAINSSGSVVQQTTRWTASERRTLITIGVSVHVSLTSIDAVNQEQNIALSPSNMIHDLYEQLGFINIEGNVMSKGTGSWNVQKSSGKMGGFGINYYNDKKTPHSLTLVSKGPIAQFQIRLSNNGVDPGTTLPFPLTDTNVRYNYWEDYTTAPGDYKAVSPSSRWTVMRWYSFTSNNLKVMPGQKLYLTVDEAIAGINTDNFVTEPSIVANGMLIGYLIVQANSSDLTTAIFRVAGKFQGSAIGGSGVGSTTLLDAYENSTLPIIPTLNVSNTIFIKNGTETGSGYTGNTHAVFKRAITDIGQNGTIIVGPGTYICSEPITGLLGVSMSNTYNLNIVGSGFPIIKQNAESFIYVATAHTPTLTISGIRFQIDVTGMIFKLNATGEWRFTVDDCTFVGLTNATSYFIDDTAEGANTPHALFNHCTFDMSAPTVPNHCILADNTGVSSYTFSDCRIITQVNKYFIYGGGLAGQSVEFERCTITDARIGFFNTGNYTLRDCVTYGVVFVTRVITDNSIRLYNTHMTASNTVYPLFYIYGSLNSSGLSIYLSGCTIIHGTIRTMGRGDPYGNKDITLVITNPTAESQDFTYTSTDITLINPYIEAPGPPRTLATLTALVGIVPGTVAISSDYGLVRFSGSTWVQQLTTIGTLNVSSVTSTATELNVLDISVQAPTSGQVLSTNGTTASWTTPTTTISPFSPSLTTWTPTIGDSTNNFTTSSATGKYMSYGPFVYVYAQLTWTSKASASGFLRIKGFPVTSINSPQQTYMTIGENSGINSTGQIYIRIEANTTYALLGRGSGQLTTSDVDATGMIWFSGIYLPEI